MKMRTHMYKYEIYNEKTTKIKIPRFNAKMHEHNIDIENWGRNLFVCVSPLPPLHIQSASDVNELYECTDNIDVKQRKHSF